MASVVIAGDTSGAITLAAPLVAGTNTITLPALTGTPVISGQNSAVTASTAWTYTTGTPSSIDFTGIPSWVKRITVTITGLSFAALGVAKIRLGTSGGLVTSGYAGGVVGVATTPAVSLDALTDGIATIAASAAGTIVTGQFVIVNVTGNTWQSTGSSVRVTDTAVLNVSNGSIALSGTLDRLSLVATTSTFDAGTINILYE